MALGVVLEINHHKGKPDLFCPKVICDVCGATIDDATMGNAHYVMKLDGEPVGVQFSCKRNQGNCVRALDHRMGHRDGEHLVAAVELDAFLVQIGANMGLLKQKDWTTARKRASMYAMV
jgi:hypothetical protein